MVEKSSKPPKIETTSGEPQKQRKIFDNVSQKRVDSILKKQDALAALGFKTPYRGNSKAYGLFFCHECEKSWSSPHSWCDKGQQCKDCKANVYPHHQTRLERSGRKEGQPPHITDLCEKCKDLGRNCAIFKPKAAVNEE